jgi:hypothetical protein
MNNTFYDNADLALLWLSVLCVVFIVCGKVADWMQKRK